MVIVENKTNMNYNFEQLLNKIKEEIGGRKMFPDLLDSIARRKILCIFAVGNKTRYKIMTAIEMKYSLFKEIDSIEDESVLNKLAAFLKSLITGPADKTFSAEEEAEIPEAVRRMSVKTGMSGQIDAKEVMHKHWEEKYG